MTRTATVDAPPDRPEIIVTRLFDAPPKRVFEAFTDPDVLGEWWGPDGFTTTTESFDFLPGGTWIHTMHAPDGTDYPNHIEFREIVEGQRIRFDHGSGPGEPLFETTIRFEAEGEQTLLTLRQVYPTIEARDRSIREHGAAEGGKQTLGRLAAYLGHPDGRGA